MCSGYPSNEALKSFVRRARFVSIDLSFIYHRYKHGNWSTGVITLKIREWNRAPVVHKRSRLSPTSSGAPLS